MSTLIGQLVDNANLIVKLLNKNKIFSQEVKVEVFKNDEKDKTTIVLNFSLDKENYSDTLYYIDNTTLRLEGKVLGVYSNVGNKIGSFLLQLQLLVMFLSNVRVLDLENFTNDPARAARGVYSDFSVKKTGSPAKWAGKDLAEQLLMSEGEMIYKPTSDSRKRVEQKMKEIVDEQKAKQNQPLPFWNNYDGINIFLRELKQYKGGGGKYKNIKNIKNNKKRITKRKNSYKKNTYKRKRKNHSSRKIIKYKI